MRKFVRENAQCDILFHRARFRWGLIYFLTSVLFTSLSAENSVLSSKVSAVQQDYCWNKYDDVASKAHAARIVVRAFCMVIYSRGNLAQFNATFYVNRVLKAEGKYKKMLEGSPKIDLNFGMDVDQLIFRSHAEELQESLLEGQTCLIPRVDLMKEYLLFLRPVTPKLLMSGDQDNEVGIEGGERNGWNIFASPEISNVASIGQTLKVFTQAKRPSISKLRSTKVKLDDRLNLQCRVKGFPSPKILWYKNGVNLEHQPSHRTVIIRRRKRTSTLRIRKASLQDAGIYRCVAVNVLGSTESQATVNVSVPTAIIPPGMTLNPVTDSWVFQGVPCQERDFCLNNGICKYYPRLNARSCKCPIGYHGTRCEGMISHSEEKFFLEVRRRKTDRKMFHLTEFACYSCSEGFEGPRCEHGDAFVTPSTVLHDTSSGAFEVFVYVISSILMVLLLAILVYSFRTFRLLSTAAKDPYSRNGSLYFRQQSTASAHSNAVSQHQVAPQSRRSVLQNGLIPHMDEKLGLLPTSRKGSVAVPVLRQPDKLESQENAEVTVDTSDTSRSRKYQWLGLLSVPEEPSNTRPHPSRPTLEGSFTITPHTSSFHHPATSFVTSDDRQL